MSKRSRYVCLLILTLLILCQLYNVSLSLSKGGWNGLQQAVNDECCKLLKRNLHKKVRHFDRSEAKRRNLALQKDCSAPLRCAANDEPGGIEFFLSINLKEMLLSVPELDRYNIIHMAPRAGGNAVAQVQQPDSLTIIEPPIADSGYSGKEVYEDQEAYVEEETYKGSIKRAKANAFDSIDTIATTTVHWRTVDSSFINQLKNASDFSYVKTGVLPPEQKNRKPGGDIDLSEIWLYILIALFVVILIWYLKENDLLLFRKKAASLDSGIYKDEEEKDIFSIAFPDSIKNALKDNNYRLAIRLHYLQLLKTLSEKGIIKYQPDKTNFDYLSQARSTLHYHDFLSATRNYEYSWYGLFPIDENSYRQIESSFTNLYKKIKG